MTHEDHRGDPDRPGRDPLPGRGGGDRRQRQRCSSSTSRPTARCRRRTATTRSTRPSTACAGRSPGPSAVRPSRSAPARLLHIPRGMVHSFQNLGTERRDATRDRHSRAARPGLLPRHRGHHQRRRPARFRRGPRSHAPPRAHACGLRGRRARSSSSRRERPRSSTSEESAALVPGDAVAL